MKNPDNVLRELGDLFEFYRQIKKFKFKDKKKSNKSVQVNVDSAALPPRA
jgi:hypothetical protein